MTVTVVRTLPQMLRVVAVEEGSRPNRGCLGALQMHFGGSTQRLKVCKAEMQRGGYPAKQQKKRQIIIGLN